MSELGRIFFSNSALTVNLTPFILIATLAALGIILFPDSYFLILIPDSCFSTIVISVFVYPGIDALLWFYFKFYGR